MKKVSLIAALCLFLLPVVGFADQVSFGTGTGTIYITGSDTLVTSIPVVTAQNTMVNTYPQFNVTGPTGTGQGSLILTGLYFNSIFPSSGYAAIWFTNVSVTIQGAAKSGATTIWPPATGPYTNVLAGMLMNSSTTVLLADATLAFVETAGKWQVTLSGTNDGDMWGSLETALGVVAPYYDIGAQINLQQITCPTGSGDVFCFDTNTSTVNYTGSPTGVVPEAATLSLLGLGLIGVLGLVRRRS
jgi:hypothetical protein